MACAGGSSICDNASIALILCPGLRIAIAALHVEIEIICAVCIAEAPCLVRRDNSRESTVVRLRTGGKCVKGGGAVQGVVGGC